MCLLLVAFHTCCSWTLTRTCTHTCFLCLFWTDNYCAVRIMRLEPVFSFSPPMFDTMAENSQYITMFLQCLNETVLVNNKITVQIKHKWSKTFVVVRGLCFLMLLLISFSGGSFLFYKLYKISVYDRKFFKILVLPHKWFWKTLS